MTPAVRRAPRGRDTLLVIQVDVVLGDVREIICSEIELRRINVLAARTLPGEVKIRGEILRRVAPRQFHTVLLAVRVIERRQDDWRTELTLVDQVVRLLVVGIEADGDPVGDLL